MLLPSLLVFLNVAVSDTPNISNLNVISSLPGNDLSISNVIVAPLPSELTTPLFETDGSNVQYVFSLVLAYSTPSITI